MNQTVQSIRVGIFFILGVILIYAVYAVIGSGSIGKDEGYHLEAVFDDIKTLTPGADVRMAGVLIGKVENTELVQGRGLVKLLIQENVEIPEDSVASIAMASLLGANYITVDYGSAGSALSDGAKIESKESTDFNKILAEVQQLGERLNKMVDGFSGFGDGSMGDLFTNLNGLVTDNRDRVDTLFVNLSELSDKLNKGEGTLGRLINDDELYDELMVTVGDIQSAAKDAKTSLSDARDLFAKVNNGEGTLGRLLADDTIAADLEATMANMRAFSEKLNSGEGTLGKLVNDDSLYIELRGMMNKADRALNSMGDSGPITAVGAVSGALF